jgi:hypothetical protein
MTLLSRSHSSIAEPWVLLWIRGLTSGGAKAMIATVVYSLMEDREHNRDLLTGLVHKWLLFSSRSPVCAFWGMSG